MDHSNTKRLFEAAAAGNTKTVVELLSNNICSVNSGNHMNSTALHFAAEAGQYECVAVLLARGADVHATNTMDDTALHCAARSMSVECMKLPIYAGCDPNAVGYLDTPMMTMIFKGENKNNPVLSGCVQTLVSLGCDINKPGHVHLNGLNILEYYIKEQNEPLVSILLQNGARGLEFMWPRGHMIKKFHFTVGIYNLLYTRTVGPESRKRTNPSDVLQMPFMRASMQRHLDTDSRKLFNQFIEGHNFD